MQYSGNEKMIDPDKIFNNSMEAATDWADKDHAAGILEDGAETLRGVIASELKQSGESVTLIRDLTRKDSRWVEMVRQWRDAKRAALIAKLKYDQVCRWQENVRTNEVTERKLANGQS